VATEVIGLGAGGHAKVVIEIILTNKRYLLRGLLDIDSNLHGKTVLNIPVLGGDDLLPSLRKEGISHFFVGRGSIGDTSPRRRLFNLASKYKMKAVEVIHPKAIISPSALFGEGVTINACAVINADATFGKNVIINTGAVVEHDCRIGDHVHIATGAHLASSVNVGNGAHIGIGAIVKQGITIGKGAVIGAGAVVVKDVPSEITVTGVPARPLSEKR
jgi:UDP-perosamine 4-acetyltransferase